MRLISTLLFIFIMCGGSAAATSLLKPYELLYVSTDDKLGGKIVFGRVMIFVDTLSVEEALATADAVGKQLIDSRTLDSVQVFAFTPRRDQRDDDGQMPDRNGTAWVSFSNTSEFQPEWANWFYEIVDPDARSMTQTTINRSSWIAPASFLDVAATLKELCNEIARCELGIDPR